MQYNGYVKRCTACKVVKPLTEFHRDSYRASGLHHHCKPCRQARLASYRAPGSKRAHRKVSKALAAGRLVRPERCPRCGGSGPIHGHHEDYSKPLDVDWMCHRCHRTLHPKERISVLKPYSFRFPEELMAAVDEARGDVPRARYVRRALETALANEFPSRPGHAVYAGEAPADAKAGDPLPKTDAVDEALAKLPGSRSERFRRATQ